MFSFGPIQESDVTQDVVFVQKIDKVRLSYMDFTEFAFVQVFSKLQEMSGSVGVQTCSLLLKKQPYTPIFNLYSNFNRSANINTGLCISVYDNCLLIVGNGELWENKPNWSSQSACVNSHFRVTFTGKQIHLALSEIRLRIYSIILDNYLIYADMRK